MEEERDLVTFTDDDGNEFELEVVDYFEHEDQEYAVLMSPEDLDNEDEEKETEVYIMKIVVNGEYEEFVPADDDKMEELIKIVEQRFDEDESCCCDDECDCEEEHEEGCCCEHCKE